MKKISILSFMLSAVLVFSSVSFAFADDKSEQEYSVSPIVKELVESVGVDAEVNARTITRAMFCEYLAHAAGNLVSICTPNTIRFEDVPIDSAYAPYIHAVSAAGLLNGVSFGTFAPDVPISTLDAIVALVRLAGYNELAAAKGGYPTGYMAVAGSIGITEGIITDNTPLNGEKLINLIYNTLHADVYQLVGMGDYDKYASYKGENVLKLYHNIHEINACVTANRYTSLSSESTNCKKDEIELDKSIYKYAYNSPCELIGQNVTAYVKMNSNSKTGTVLCISIDENNNKIITLSSDDDLSIDGYKLFYIDGSKTKTAALKRGFTLIYNSKNFSKAVPSDLVANDSALTLIDRDLNGEYETVIMNQAITTIVVNIDRTEYIIYGENDFCINYNSVDNSSSFEITDTQGKELFIDEVKKNNVLTVYKSKDNSYIKAVMSDIKVSGQVTAKDEVSKTVYVTDASGEKEYKISSGYEDRFTVGMTGAFFLDSLGRILCPDNVETKNWEYGYLAAVSFNNGLDSSRLKIYTASGFETFECSNKLIIDGRREDINKTSNNAIVKNATLYPQAVRYQLDSDNRLKIIDTVEVGTESDSMKETKFENISYFNSGFKCFENVCVLGDKTLAVKVPLSPKYSNDEDYYSKSANMFIKNKKQNTFAAYDMDEFLVPRLIVVKNDSTTVGEGLNDYSAMGIVTEKIRALNNEGEDRNALHITDLSGVKSTVYFENDDTGYADVEFGDIILYLADETNNIKEWKYDLDYSVSVSKNTYISYDSFTKYMGYPYAKSGTYFSFLNSFNNPDLEETQEHLLTFPVKVMKFMEVDFETKEVSVSSYEYVGEYKHNKNTDSISYVKVYGGGSQYKDMLITYKNCR